jgi:hypothetical protein
MHILEHVEQAPRLRFLVPTLNPTVKNCEESKRSDYYTHSRHGYLCLFCVCVR